MPSISIYSKLAAADADALRQVAARIQARTRDAIIATGRDLIETKRRLPHGAFGRWVRSELGMTERTASNYMAAASISAELADGKSETFSKMPAPLPATVLYRLAAAPEPVRAVLVQRAMGGERLTVAAVAEARAEARAEAERKAREARVSRRTKAARLRQQEEWRRQRDETMARQRAGEDAARQVAALLLRHLPAEARTEARRLLSVVDTNSGWHPVGKALHAMLVDGAGSDEDIAAGILGACP